MLKCIKKIRDKSGQCGNQIDDDQNDDQKQMMIEIHFKKIQNWGI